MTTDKQTLIDRRTKTVQRTGRHSSRPDEVLFFSTAHFLFFNLSQPTLAHLALPPTTQADTRAKPKEPILSSHNFIFPTLTINLKIISQ